ncbi:beta-ketoacyl synthase domain-containing protein [Colletotrichum sp. SAR11_240]|nr:beta-ketoacyl synthase domain-containing protein [Colletotrichum sp. SAR11_240]
MDVIEIGAGTGGATKHILSRPQLGLNSYTYTDISTDFFQQARPSFAEFDTGEPMQFESLDIRWSRAEQGFKEHPYDLIIASNVLHAIPKLGETMTLEITHHANLFPTSVFSTYAAGSRIGALYNPLSAPLKTPYPALVVVGGKFSETRRITEELAGILPHRSVQSITGLDELASADLQLKSTFVVLSEIDDEIFAHLDEAKFEAVENLLFLAGKVLWLTESA